MENWTTTTFESSPISTDLVGQTFAYIQLTRKAVGERLRVEHDMDDSHGTSGQGVHTMGSARAFIVDAATASPPASPALPVYVLADGPTKGRIAFKRIDETLDGAPKTFYKTFFYYKDGTASPIDAWVEPSYMHLGNVAETSYGIKTFFDWPVVSDITGIAEDDPYAGHSDSTLVPVAAVKRALLDQVAALQNAIIPIGFLYVQYPGFSSPVDLWSWATWSYSESAAAFAGAFFRAEGTDAKGFGAGLQAQQLPEHDHGLTSDNKLVDPDTVTSGEGLDWTTGVKHYNLVDLPANTESAGTGTTLYPKNFTIRIWKRTA